MTNQSEKDTKRLWCSFEKILNEIFFDKKFTTSLPLLSWFSDLSSCFISSDNDKWIVLELYCFFKNTPIVQLYEVWSFQVNVNEEVDLSSFQSISELHSFRMSLPIATYATQDEGKSPIFSDFKKFEVPDFGISNIGSFNLPSDFWFCLKRRRNGSSLRSPFYRRRCKYLRYLS